MSKKIIIYQNKSGQIEFREDLKNNNIWATQAQISNVFNVNIPTINEHIKNIYKTKELNEKSTIRKFRIVQKEGKRKVEREIIHYNLDIIISVGYRVNSKTATKFRQWATSILKKHTLQGYTINKKIIGKNYYKFMSAISNVKALLPNNTKIETSDILELISTFANTWFSLKAYDTETFPKKGITKKRVIFTAKELIQTLEKLKKNLISKKQTTDLFGRERNQNSIQGIIGNVFQSAFGKEMYPSIEEKAAHLLYFMVKNHPFIDGNKRNGAFAFIWFLKKTGTLRASLSPETLTALTLLIAESKTEDKNKMTGLVLLLLKE